MSAESWRMQQQRTRTQQIISEQCQKDVNRFVNHELRQYLGVIDLTLESIINRTSCIDSENFIRLDKEIKDTILESKCACANSVLLLNNLALIDKMQSTKSPILKNDIKIIDLISTNVDKFNDQLRAKHIHLTLNQIVDLENNSHQVLQGEDHIYGDWIKFDTLIQIMISNAIRFTEDGESIEITLSFEPDLKQSDSDLQKGKLVIEIKAGDSSTKRTGSEIGNEEEFFEFHPENLQCGGDSGLGLSICKTIVEIYGGEISLLSGTTLKIELPMNKHKELLKNCSTSYTSLSDPENLIHDSLVSEESSSSKINFCLRELVSSVSHNYKREDSFWFESENVLHTGDLTPQVTPRKTWCPTTVTSLKVDVTDSSNHCPTNVEYIPSSSWVTLDPDQVLNVRGPSPGISSLISKWDFRETINSESTQNDDSSKVTSIENNDLSFQSPITFRDIPKPKVILIVDDIQSLRKMMRRFFEKKGYVVHEAADGIKAIEMVKESRKVTRFGNGFCTTFLYDTILMDFEMPYMKGPEATEEIRKLFYTGHIIGITGNVMDADMNLFIDSGADHVLMKPADLNYVESLISNDSVSEKYLSF